MNNKTKPLQLLRDGYKQQFAEYVFESEAFADLLMDTASVFVDEHLDVIQDEMTRTELAMLLMESIRLGNY